MRAITPIDNADYREERDAPLVLLHGSVGLLLGLLRRGLRLDVLCGIDARQALGAGCADGRDGGHHGVCGQDLGRVVHGRKAARQVVAQDVVQLVCGLEAVLRVLLHALEDDAL